MDVTITNAAVDEQLNLKVTRAYKVDLPSFGMLGNTERRTKVQSINMHSILKNLSKTSTYHFWLFIEQRNPRTNKVKYVPADNASAKRMTVAYKELNSLDVLKRVKRGEYMINPRAFIPSDNNFENALDEWNNL